MTPSRSLNVALAAILLLLGVTLLFESVTGFEYIQLDDPKHLSENPHLNPPALVKLPALWEKPYFGLYIPATYTAWGLTAILTMQVAGNPGMAPGVFHALNLVFHAANTLLVFFLILRLCQAISPPVTPGQRLWVPERELLSAFLGAAVFAVHPVQIEAVAWVSCLKDLLSTFFCLVALHGVLEGESPGRTRRHRVALWAGSLAAFALATVAKPNTVVFPLLAAGIARCFLGMPVARLCAWFIPWGIAALPVVWLTAGIQPTSEMKFVTPIALRPLIALDALAFYLQKLFLPLPLSLDYGRTPSAVLAEGAAHWARVALVALAALVLSRRAARSAPSTAWALPAFVVSLIPVLGLVPFLFQIFSTVADRYLYLPVAVAAIFLATHLHRRAGALGFGLAGMAVIALGALSASHLPRWRNGVEIFAHTVAVNPRSVVGQNNLGVEYQTRGRYREAAEAFAKALENDPGRYDLYGNLGAALVAAGDLEEGIGHLLTAEANGGHAGIVHYNLGRAYLRLGRFEEAARYAERAIAVDPGVPRVRELLQSAFRLAGRSRSRP